MCVCVSLTYVEQIVIKDDNDKKFQIEGRTQLTHCKPVCVHVCVCVSAVRRLKQRLPDKKNNNNKKKHLKNNTKKKVRISIVVK